MRYNEAQAANLNSRQNSAMNAKPPRKTIISSKFLLILVILVVSISGCDSADQVVANEVQESGFRGGKLINSLPVSELSPVTDTSPNTRYFFNVKGHTKEQVESLLLRALEIYEAMPAEGRETLEIAMVLHGPDTQYFAKKNYSENKNLVDLAAKLEASGFVDLKVCAVSAKSQGIDDDGFPSFIEIVPYGPQAIENLKQAGFTEI